MSTLQRFRAFFNHAKVQLVYTIAGACIGISVFVLLLVFHGSKALGGALLAAVSAVYAGCLAMDIWRRHNVKVRLRFTIVNVLFFFSCFF
jgi:hypothetical protein